MKKILILMLITLSFSSCEKDDICTDDTTPRLINEFFDIVNPSNTKNVNNLSVKVLGNSNVYKSFSGVSKIELPLKMNDTSSSFSLTLNSTDLINTNTDIININYSTRNVYVSRACGYKTVFDLNSTDGFVATDTTPIDNKWIQQSIILTPTIENENETHIKILF